MNIGISTACFYPDKTEDALSMLACGGFDVAEIFLNSFSELEPDFIAKLKRISDDQGVRICSIHPFTCIIEGFLLFSDYGRRFSDGLALYERYCRAAQLLGAKILVMHGDASRQKLPITEVAKRYTELADMCAGYGVALTLENVVKYASESMDYIRRLLDLCKGKLKLTFDIKQAVRSKVDPFAFIDEFGGDIIHLHLSDHDSTHDCLPPGKGKFDFGRFMSRFGELGYTGDAVIELYSRNFSSVDQLLSSKRLLENLNEH